MMLPHFSPFLPRVSCATMKYILFRDVTPGSLVDNYDLYANLAIVQKVSSQLFKGGGGLGSPSGQFVWDL